MNVRRTYVWAAAIVVCTFALAALFWFQKETNFGSETPATGLNNPSGAGTLALGSTPSKRNPAATELLMPYTAPIDPAQAAFLDTAVRQKQIEEREAFRAKITNLIQSKRLVTLKQRAGEYQLVPDVYALPEERLRTISEYELLDKRSRDSIVRLEAGTEIPSGAQPVVYSAARNALGSVTGNFTVVLKDGADAESIAQGLKLELIQSFPAHHLAFFRGPSSRVEELLPVAQQISRDPNVASVELEVRERVYVPH